MFYFFFIFFSFMIRIPINTSCFLIYIYSIVFYAIMSIKRTLHFQRLSSNCEGMWAIFISFSPLAKRYYSFSSDYIACLTWSPKKVQKRPAFFFSLATRRIYKPHNHIEIICSKLAKRLFEQGNFAINYSRSSAQPKRPRFLNFAIFHA